MFAAAKLPVLRLVVATVTLLACGSLQATSPPGASVEARCGTARSALLARGATSRVPGDILYLTQKPRAVHFGYQGKLRYRDIAVWGDFESVDFLVDDPLGSPQPFSVERKRREVTASGDVISFFDVTGTLEEWVFWWHVDVTTPLLYSQLLYLGPESAPRPVYLPISVLPKKIPGSKVVRLGKVAQYASNVLNLALPDLHDRLLQQPGTFGFVPAELIAEVLPEYLDPAAYDDYGIGIGAAVLPHSTWGAFHWRVDNGPPYSVYKQDTFSLAIYWNHEINHNWNFRYDLRALVGYPSGFDGAHGNATAALEAGYLCCGAYPIRKVDGQWRTIYARERHPFHPIELYAMGLLPAEEVDDIFVFKRTDLRDFVADEPMSGPTRRLTMERIAEEYGPPVGSGASVWRVAPIVVSRKLLPKRELKALNYFLRRIEDPDGDVPESFDRSTGSRMDLTTSIEIRGRSRPAPPRGVSFPSIGKQELAGINLDHDVPGCVAPGGTLTLVGRAEIGVTPEVALVPRDPKLERVEAVVTPLGGGRFHAVLEPLAEDHYELLFEAVWPPHRPREVGVSPVIVDAACPPGG